MKIYILALYIAIPFLLIIQNEKMIQDSKENAYTRYYKIALDYNHAYNGLISPLHVVNQIKQIEMSDFDIEIAKQATEDAMNDYLFLENENNIKYKIIWRNDPKYNN